MTRAPWVGGVALAVSLAACGALIGVDDRYSVTVGVDAQGTDRVDSPFEGAPESAEAGDEGGGVFDVWAEGVDAPIEAGGDESADAVADSAADAYDASADRGDENDASSDHDASGEADADASLPPPLLVANHLKLWLRADHGLTCQSGRLTRWADQSGNGRDATLQLGELGPQCALAQHSVRGVSLPYFSAPTGSNVIDETLDVDLSFLEGTNYTTFAVERRWADYPSGDGNHYEFVVGTSMRNEATLVIGDCSGTALFNTAIFFGYVYYDGFPELSLDQFCSKINGRVSPVSPSPADLTLDTALFDMARGHEIFQGGIPIGASSDTNPLSFAGGGAIGRGFIRTTAPGADGRFRGDIAEVLVYDAALDDVELATITSYLKAQWGLP